MKTIQAIFKAIKKINPNAQASMSGTDISAVDTITFENGTQPINKQDITSNYYYVYYYNHFIGMINVALETAFNLLITDILKLNDYTPLDATVSPFLDFDHHRNTMIFYDEFFAYDEV